MEIKKGQLIAITSGQYSDYCLRGHMRALRDFETNQVIDEFKDTGDYLVPAWWDATDTTTEGCRDRFLAWLIRQGILENVGKDTVVEWLVESYGALDSD